MSRILCRLCALESEKFVDIYESDDSNTEIEAKIVSCLQIWVSKEDALPKTVCMKCCFKLNEFFYFLQKSKKAQLLLKEIYEPQKKDYEKKNNDCGIEIPSNIRCELQDSNDNGNSEIKETEIQEDFVSRPENKPCSQLDLTDESLRDENLKNQNEKLLTIVGNNDKECDEVMNLIGVMEKKSRRHKQDRSLNDAPANPRLTHLLKEYSWPCTMCEDRIMNSLEDLKDHYKSEHQQPPVFKCITCEKQYDRYRSFTRHIKMHSNPKRYSCETCGKSFAQRSVLQSHAMVHSSEKPHVCQTCGKSFKNFSSLYVHGKRHLPDQVKEKYCCDSCEKQFSTRHTLETHKKIHTGERNFVCDICGKSFVAKSSLDYHLLTHTGDKNHVCSTCGKAFKTARLLGKHISLHTGIKPHQCDVCGKQFRERGALREHSRIHTGAMPYSCEFCGKCFRFKGILTVHRRQHTGERPYACLECRRHFTNWANYNKHMKRIHHCDTSNRENSRQRSSADTVQSNVTSNENSKSVGLTTEEKKMIPYSISSRNTSQKRESSTEPAVDTDHN